MLSFLDDDSRWAAHSTRNPAADGHFFTCVRTTKIYCRPTCKARTPRRANVTFVNTPQEAERAGYRACKRCKPNLAGTMPQEKAVRMVTDFIQHHEALSSYSATPALTDGTSEPDSPRPPEMNLRQMAAASGLSKWHFHRVFKQVTGMTPREWMKNRSKASSETTSIQDLLTMDQDLLFQDPFFFDLGGDEPAISDPPSMPFASELWPSDVVEHANSKSTQVPVSALGDPEWTVVYATRNLPRGQLLLVLFHQGQVAMVRQLSDASEVADVLDKQFPQSFFTQIPLEAAPDSSSTLSNRVDELVKLIELPV